MKTMLLVDGNNLFHRAYHALPPLNDKSGENANAVFGFSNMLLKATDELKPDYVACAFDTAAPTFRHIEFEKYKAHRPPPPPDLYPQLPKVKEVLDAFGVAYFEEEGYEADDILGTIAAKSGGKGVNVIILSGDRDVLQIVDGYIKVQMPGWNMKDVTLYGRKEVIKKFGIEPRQMVDYKSLIGDSSDNVPGVAGIGPKTASSLLQKYDNLETIYERIEEIAPKVSEKLKKDKEQAFAAMRLVELDLKVPIGFKLQDLKFNPSWEKVKEEYEKLGFKSIAAKISIKGGLENEEPEKVSPKPKKQKQLELI